MSNRSELVTALMVSHMQAKYAHLRPEYLDSTLHDWNALGLHYGHRLGKWAQNVVDKIMVINIDGMSTAFIYEDMTFYGSNTRTLPQSWYTEIDASEIAFAKF